MCCSPAGRFSSAHARQNSRWWKRAGLGNHDKSLRRAAAYAPQRVQAPPRTATVGQTDKDSVGTEFQASGQKQSPAPHLHPKPHMRKLGTNCCPASFSESSFFGLPSKQDDRIRPRCRQHYFVPGQELDKGQHGGWTPWSSLETLETSLETRSPLRTKK